MALVQTVKHSPEEEHRLATLQEQQDQLMTRAEEIWKRIAEAWQGIGIPESAPKGSEWEATNKVWQYEALGREKTSSLLPTQPQ